MAYNGSGTFVRLHDWTTDLANTVPVTASRMDDEMDGMATGLSTAICKDGQTTTTARIPFASGVSATGAAASAAAYARSSDNDTGLYFPAADQWGLAAGGTGTLTSTSTALTGGSGVTLTISGALTVSSGGFTVTGNSSVTGTLTSSGALTVSADGAAITGNSSVTGTLSVSSTLTASNGFTVSAGTVTLPAGSIETADLADSAVTPVKQGVLLRVMDADEAGGNVNTAQPWFPTSGAVAVAADTTYEFSGLLRFTRSAGTNSHTISQLFGGTATLTNIDWQAVVNDSDSGDITNTPANVSAGAVATAVVLTDAITSATEDRIIRIRGIVRIADAGTFIPQFQFSAAPGGAPTIQQNSYFLMRKLGSGSLTTVGTWS